MVDTLTMSTRTIKTMLTISKGVTTTLILATNSSTSTLPKQPNPPNLTSARNRPRRLKTSQSNLRQDPKINLMILTTSRCLRAQVLRSTMHLTATRRPRANTKRSHPTRVTGKSMTTARLRLSNTMVDTIMSGTMTATTLPRTTTMATMTTERVAESITPITTTSTALRRVMLTMRIITAGKVRWTTTGLTKMRFLNMRKNALNIKELDRLKPA